MIRCWRSKAVALRVARIRLRTVVSRWLRVELGAIFSCWNQQVVGTRTLFTASERVSKRRQYLCMQARFKEWIELLDEQEHRKNVLTKIVLRTQDRTLLKALHVWLQIASSLAIIKHLADQGLRKYRAATILNAFQSWQDLRTRGFKAMDMMDLSTSKWNKKLIEECFAALRDLTQHTRLCNSRGLLIWARHVSQEQQRVIDTWKWVSWTRRRLATIEEALRWRTTRARQLAAFRGWVTLPLPSCAFRCQVGGADVGGGAAGRACRGDPDSVQPAAQWHRQPPAPQSAHDLLPLVEHRCRGQGSSLACL